MTRFRITELREQRGVTLRQLADATGIGKDTLVKLDRWGGWNDEDKRNWGNVRPEVISALHTYFDAQPDELMEFQKIDIPLAGRKTDSTGKQRWRGEKD